MCDSRAVLFHLNSLLAVVAGAALVTMAVVLPGDLPERAGDIPSATTLLMVPYIAGPLLLAISHIGIAALHTAHRIARVLLVIYSVVCAVAACAALGLMGWSGYVLANWLHESPDSFKLLRADENVRNWLRPLLPLMGAEREDTLPEEAIRVEVVSVLVVCGVTIVLLLVNAALALAARPRRMRDDEHALRRCSSVYYEPSTPPFKTPLDDRSMAWQ